MNNFLARNLEEQLAMKKSNTCEIIYDFICDNPGLSTYEISKKLNMSGGRVRHALSRLQKIGLIEFKFERQSPRIKKLTYPISAMKLLPEKLKRELRNMI